MSNNPKRPDNVPEDALWNANDNEWGLGVIEDGKYKGPWKWWRPDGAVVCETNFDDEGFVIDYTRYHPDGTISRQGTYNGNVEHGVTMCCRSHEETNEFFPPRAQDYPEIWKTLSTFEDGYIIQERYFLEDGAEFFLPQEDKEAMVQRTSVRYFADDGTELFLSDEDDTEEEEEEEEKEEIIQVTFDSVEEASKRWTVEGLKFFTELNKWLAEGYAANWENVDYDTEPQETRHNMINYVIDYVAKANENNDFTSPRELFNPSHEPMRSFKEEQGEGISKVMLLDDMRIITRVGNYWKEPKVYEINNNQISLLEKLKAIGVCPNKKYYAKAYEDKIEITDGWHGKVVTTLDLPEFEDVIDDFDFEDYDDYDIIDIQVFPDGKKLLLVTDMGIFAVAEDESQFVYPYGESFDEDLEACREDEYFALKYDMIHAAISHDGKYIALGCQDSSHIIMDEDYDEIGVVYPRSEYPHFAMFHPKCNYVAFNSCHFYKGCTVAAPLDIVDGLEADAYEGDKELLYLDDNSRVYAAVPLEKGILIGDAYGYLHFKEEYKKDTWYCFVGSTICNIDISKDEKFIVVSTYGGVIHQFNLEPDEKDDFLITSGKIKQEKQWMFFKDYKPMVW